MNGINIVFPDYLHNHFDDVISYLGKSRVKEQFFVIFMNELGISGRKTFG